MRVFSLTRLIGDNMCDGRRESDPLWVIISGLIDRLMSSPVDVPGRSLPNDSATISTSPNDMSYIDIMSPDHFKMVNMSNALTRPDCPFPLIPGEVLEEVAEFPNSKGYLTNYRLIILSLLGGQTKVEAIAIGNMDAIDSSQNSDMLHILCKDARVIRVQTSSLDQTVQWYKKLTALAQAKPAPSLFAMKFSKSMEGKTESWCRSESTPEFVQDEQALFTRWGMDPDYFSVVDYNNDYSICSSYPRTLIVPKAMDKREIESLRDYRMLGRIPAVVWHCAEKSVLLLRASQPRVALMNWRNEKDEKFLRLVTEYTSRKREDNSGKIRIFDCRSYMATLGNRIKGGGSEREEHYSNMKLDYCNLPNIHNVRYTFDALRKLFNPPVEQATFLSSLQATNWLSTIMAILMHSNKAAEQLEKGRNVLIHCSDGWDRTTQLVTLVKILVDPYYRTIAGLEELIRRDWIGYGHKFSDRNGISGTDANERCPVFLQWLDALHQIHVKYPHRFEYSMAYLVKLAAHTSSGLFTSFCFNTVQEMETVLDNERVTPFPIWRMLNSDKCYENALYDRDDSKSRLLAPDNMQTMRLWNEVYRCQEVVSLLTTTEEERRGREGREEGAAAGGGGGGEGERRSESSVAEKMHVVQCVEHERSEKKEDMRCGSLESLLLTEEQARKVVVPTNPQFEYLEEEWCEKRVASGWKSAPSLIQWEFEEGLIEESRSDEDEDSFLLDPSETSDISNVDLCEDSEAVVRAATLEEEWQAEPGNKSRSLVVTDAIKAVVCAATVPITASANALNTIKELIAPDESTESTEENEKEENGIDEKKEESQGGFLDSIRNLPSTFQSLLPTYTAPSEVPAPTAQENTEHPGGEEDVDMGDISVVEKSDCVENEEVVNQKENEEDEEEMSFMTDSKSARNEEKTEVTRDEEDEADTSFVMVDEEEVLVETPHEPSYLESLVNGVYSWIPSMAYPVSPASEAREESEKNTIVEDEKSLVSPVEISLLTGAQANGADTASNGSGMDRSMVKSRSSESIASTSESQTFPPTSSGGSLRMTESDEEGEATRERRNTRTSSASGEALVAVSNGGGAIPNGQQPSSTATPSPAPSSSTSAASAPAAAAAAAATDLRTMLDNDGLVRFVDATQESARKKFAEFEESASKKEERQRMRSEMSDVSIGGRGDDEPFQMDDVMSDASIVEDHELFYTPKHNGTQVHAANCSVCRHTFTIMTHKMNCHSCGRAVCSRCASHTYMETCDGVARSRRACNECYCKMHSTPTSLTPQTTSTSSSHGGGRGCPDGEGTPTRSPYVSPSQAVKG